MEYNNYSNLYECIKNNIFEDGIHTLKLENTTINAEIYNIYDDIIYDTDTMVGNNTIDSYMLILIYHKNMTINENVLFTPKVRKKGMFIYCKKSLINNGIISMSQRGAVSKGDNIYLFDYNNKKVILPAIGGLGGEQVISIAEGIKPGLEGKTVEIGCGGGGSGATNAHPGWVGISGCGGNATSYSGGPGGGAGAFGTGYNGSNTGGSGGIAYTVNSVNIASGGAGNPGDRGNSLGTNDINGTGGLLLIYAKKLINNNIIESKGTRGSDVSPYISYPSYHSCVTGGGSGGGCIIIYTESSIREGIIDTSGGDGGNINTKLAEYCAGGKGGNGSINIFKDIKFIIRKNYNYYNLNLSSIELDNFKEESFIIEELLEKISYTRIGIFKLTKIED